MPASRADHVPTGALDEETARPADPLGRRGRREWPLGILAVVVLAVGVGAIALGRYAVPVEEVIRILASRVLPVRGGWDSTEYNVVILVRLPRIALTMLVGAGLAVSGAVLQAVLRNPVADPHILGVSSGASFGGALMIFLGLGSVPLVSAAFGFGVLALAIVFFVGRSVGSGPTLTIVLAGVVTGAFFTALVSFLTFLADPETQLQSIVFWLLGSFASATYTQDLVAAVPILCGITIALALRWRVNVLSLGDEDARAVGVNPQRVRWLLLFSVAIITSASVAVSGVIGWVGLVIPHIARPLVGADHRRLLPASALIGAGYLTAIDTIARSILPAEIPVGVLTAVVGTPVFFVLLRRARNGIWADA